MHFVKVLLHTRMNILSIWVMLVDKTVYIRINTHVNLYTCEKANVFKHFHVHYPFTGV